MQSGPSLSSPPPPSSPASPSPAPLPSPPSSLQAAAVQLHPPGSPLPAVPPFAAAGVSPSSALDLLQRALDADGATRVVATQRLASLQAASGHGACLLLVALSAGAVPDSVRVLAAIELKNSVTALFAAANRNAASSDGAVSGEREWLRSVLLGRLSESVDAVSTQLCLCLAAMAKFDASRQWPSLLPSLLSGAASGDRVCCLRYTFALHCTVKQLQAVKTPQGRNTFAALAAAAAPHVASQATQHTQRLCELLSQSGGILSEGVLADLIFHCRVATLAVKIAGRLFSSAGVNIDNSADCRAAVSLSCNAIRFLLPVRSGIPASHPLHARVSDLLVSLGRLLVDLQREQPLSFRSYLRDAVEWSEWVVERSFGDAGELVHRELSVLALSLLQHVLREPVYQSASGSARSGLTFSLHGGLKVDPAASASAQSLKAAVVTPRLVSSLCAALLNRFFPLSPSELRAWSGDAEHFILESTLDDEWPRATALNLFGFLVQQHTQQVASHVLQTLHALAQPPPTASSPSPTAASPLSPPSSAAFSPSSPQSSSSAALSSDVSLLNARGAAYLALAGCCNELPPLLAANPAVFDFHAFFAGTLRDELSGLLAALAAAPASSAASAGPLHSARSCLASRVLHLLGEWCEAVPVASHSAVYELVGRGLSVSDVAVRFAAAKCLERFVVCQAGGDDAAVAARVYADYVDRLFRLLFPLVDALDSLDLQNSLVHVVRASMGVLQAMVAPAVGTLLDALPRLWAACDDSSNNLLRATLLDTLRELTAALGPHSQAIQPFALQAIAYCLDHTKRDREYLHSSALELWSATVYHATSITQELLSLFSAFLHCFADSADVESLPECLRLIESYALLGGVQFMTRYAAPLSGLLLAWLDRVGDRGLSELSCTLESLCQLFPAEFPSVFGRSCLHLLHSLLAVQRYSALPAGERSSASSIGLPSDLVCGHYLYVYARLFFSNYAGGLAVVREYASQCGASGDAVLRSLLTVWLLKLDAVAELYKRKLSVLAIGRILQEQQHSDDQQHVVEWIVAATGVQAEMDRGEEGPPDSPSAADGDISQARGTETERRQKLGASDAATLCPLPSFVLSVLSSLQSRSPDSLQRVLDERLPPAIRAALHQFAQRGSAAKQAAFKPLSPQPVALHAPNRPLHTSASQPALSQANGSRQ